MLLSAHLTGELTRKWIFDELQQRLSKNFQLRVWSDFSDLF
jgi:hypothetical protein